MERKVVIHRGVDMGAAKMIVEDYRKSEEEIHDKECRIGIANGVVSTLTYGNGTQRQFYVYQTKTSIIVRRANWNDDTSNPITN